jgi:hypothetical protein
MPQVILNKQNWKEAREGLELSRELAKQVLSQLNYTPTVATDLDSKASAAVREHRNTNICPIGLDLARGRIEGASVFEWRRALLSRHCISWGARIPHRLRTRNPYEVNVPVLLLMAGLTGSEPPLVSTHWDHIRFGCESSRKCDRTRGTRCRYRDSFCSRIENSR